jgi:hypothetical protein
LLFLYFAYTPWPAWIRASRCRLFAKGTNSPIRVGTPVGLRLGFGHRERKDHVHGVSTATVFHTTSSVAYLDLDASAGLHFACSHAADQRGPQAHACHMCALAQALLNSCDRLKCPQHSRQSSATSSLFDICMVWRCQEPRVLPDFGVRLEAHQRARYRVARNTQGCCIGTSWFVRPPFRSGIAWTPIYLFAM